MRDSSRESILMSDYQFSDMQDYVSLWIFVSRIECRAIRTSEEFEKAVEAYERYKQFPTDS